MNSSLEELRVRASERERRNKILVINKPPHSSHGFKMNCIHPPRSIHTASATLQLDKVIWHLNGIQFTLIEKVFQQLHCGVSACKCVNVCMRSLETKECVWLLKRARLEEISIGWIASKGKSAKLPMRATTKNRLLK